MWQKMAASISQQVAVRAEFSRRVEVWINELKSSMVYSSLPSQSIDAFANGMKAFLNQMSSVWGENLRVPQVNPFNQFATEAPPSTLQEAYNKGVYKAINFLMFNYPNFIPILSEKLSQVDTLSDELQVARHSLDQAQQTLQSEQHRLILDIQTIRIEAARTLTLRETELVNQIDKLTQEFAELKAQKNGELNKLQKHHQSETAKLSSQIGALQATLDQSSAVNKKLRAENEKLKRQSQQDKEQKEELESRVKDTRKLLSQAEKGYQKKESAFKSALQDQQSRIEALEAQLRQATEAYEAQIQALVKDQQDVASLLESLERQIKEIQLDSPSGMLHSAEPKAAEVKQDSPNASLDNTDTSKGAKKKKKEKELTTSIGASQEEAIIPKPEPAPVQAKKKVDLKRTKELSQIIAANPGCLSSIYLNLVNEWGKVDFLIQGKEFLDVVYQNNRYDVVWDLLEQNYLGLDGTNQLQRQQLLHHAVKERAEARVELMLKDLSGEELYQLFDVSNSDTQSGYGVLPDMVKYKMNGPLQIHLLDEYLVIQDSPYEKMNALIYAKVPSSAQLSPQQKKIELFDFALRIGLCKTAVKLLPDVDPSARTLVENHFVLSRVFESDMGPIREIVVGQIAERTGYQGDIAQALQIISEQHASYEAVQRAFNAEKLTCDLRQTVVEVDSGTDETLGKTLAKLKRNYFPRFDHSLLRRDGDPSLTQVKMDGLPFRPDAYQQIKRLWTELQNSPAKQIFLLRVMFQMLSVDPTLFENCFTPDVCRGIKENCPITHWICSVTCAPYAQVVSSI
jgi:hypothetical protein